VTGVDEVLQRNMSRRLGNNLVNLTLGMAVTVEIKTDSRTVIGYFCSRRYCNIAMRARANAECAGDSSTSRCSGLRRSWSLPLSQPYSRTSAIFIDELDAGCLECAANR
jgi:hypothetical protein